MVNEAGGHRIQRIPPTERNGRVHTSSVTVAILNKNSKEFSIKDSDLKVEWFSGTGKGGQHRNRHQNCCRLIHIPTGLVQIATGRERQSNYSNAKDALVQRLMDENSQKQHQHHNKKRKTQIGLGMRGDKRRTYRFRDNQVHDHINDTKASCDQVMKGNFDLLW